MRCNINKVKVRKFNGKLVVNISLNFLAIIFYFLLLVTMRKIYVKKFFYNITISRIEIYQVMVLNQWNGDWTPQSLKKASAILSMRRS